MDPAKEGSYLFVLIVVVPEFRDIITIDIIIVKIPIPHQLCLVRRLVDQGWICGRYYEFDLRGRGIICHCWRKGERERAEEKQERNKREQERERESRQQQRAKRGGQTDEVKNVEIMRIRDPLG
jgi:hypothetical protein